MNILKPLTDEIACNATPNTFGNTQCVRIVNSSTGLRILTIKDVHSVVTASINTSINATSLIILSSGDTTRFRVGDFVVNSDNVAVINTNTLSTISQIINSSAFITNVTVIVANGSANISIANLISNSTLLGNSVTIVAKNRSSTLHSNNNTDVLGQGVAFRD